MDMWGEREKTAPAAKWPWNLFAGGENLTQLDKQAVVANICVE